MYILKNIQRGLVYLIIFSTPIYAANDTTMSNTITAADQKSGLIDAVGNITPKGDQVITNSIQNYINNSKTLSSLNITVKTQRGVVTLSGTVDSNSQASTLIALAESIIGVKDVHSNLHVAQGSQMLADTIITAKIKGLLIREKLFGEKDISAINTQVETKNGVVYLTGYVDNKAQINNAITIIRKNVPEVKRVEYNLQTLSETPAS